jgi:hypothetical protein
MENICESRMEGGRRFCLVILCVLLLLTATVTAMRPLKTDAQENLVESFQTQPNVEAVVIHAEETAEADADEDLNCENYRDKEDCDLNRRTLAAHTDYIYTQHHGHP